MFFLLSISVKNCVTTSYSSGVMVNTTFPIMDEVIWFQAMSEFLHQDCVKLIGTGVANKHSCALRPLSILNMGSITTFLPTSLSIYLKWKLKKTLKEVNRAVKTIFFPRNVYFLMWSIKWRWNKKKTFLWQNFPCGGVWVYHSSHLFYFHFM